QAPGPAGSHQHGGAAHGGVHHSLAAGPAMGARGPFGRAGLHQRAVGSDWGDRGAVAGNALLLLAAMLWAASIVHNRGHAWRATPFQLAPWQALLAAALLTLAALSIEGPPVVSWNGHSLALLLFAGIPGTALAYWAAAVSSSELPASTTSLGLLGTPAVSVVVALLLLGEAPTFPL